jgi:DNA-binding NarL/FixJ family response regulator
MTTTDKSISDRERQCLEFAAEGLTNKEIAKRLNLSHRTIEIHIGEAMRRLQAVNRTHAACILLRKSLL